MERGRDVERKKIGIGNAKKEGKNLVNEFRVERPVKGTEGVGSRPFRGASISYI